MLSELLSATEQTKKRSELSFRREVSDNFASCWRCTLDRGLGLSGGSWIGLAVRRHNSPRPAPDRAIRCARRNIRKLLAPPRIAAPAAADPISSPHRPTRRFPRGTFPVRRPCDDIAIGDRPKPNDHARRPAKAEVPFRYVLRDLPQCLVRTWQ
jgi:hypothetical protein